MSTKPLAHQVVTGPDGAESASAADGATRPRDSLFHWCGTVDALINTDDAGEKRAFLEAYFSAIADESVGPATRFFAGDIFAGSPTRIPWTLIAKAIEDLTRLNAGRRRRSNRLIDPRPVIEICHRRRDVAHKIRNTCHVLIIDPAWLVGHLVIIGV